MIPLALRLALTKSPRTTIAGLASILGATASVVTALTDGNPATMPDWTLTATNIVIGAGLILSRDHVVSSEKGCIKPPFPKE